MTLHVKPSRIFEIEIERIETETVWRNLQLAVG